MIPLKNVKFGPYRNVAAPTPTAYPATPVNNALPKPPLGKKIYQQAQQAEGLTSEALLKLADENIATIDK